MSIVLRIGAVRGNPYGADHLTSGQDATNSDSDVLDIPAAEEVCHRPAQTYPGCFGLPYQDHNYGAPPPLSPTPPKSPPALPPEKVNGVTELEEEAKVPVVSQEEEVVEDSITRCICGFLHDDGYMICCDKCSVWQHIDCMGVDRNNIPENYCCELCEPRKLDFERAKMIQLRKREEIDTSATDTDPEEPANALASLGKKQVQTKPKVAKQRRSSKAGAREKGLLKSAKLARAGQYRRDKKLKLTKKEKENMKGANKKQKMMKNSLARQKKMKKKLSASLSQNKAEQWNSLYGLWHNYEEAKENEYSPEILELLSRAKSNGIHSPHSIGVFPEELLVRLYQVSEVKKNRKGLEATDLIVPGRAVIEFKGKVMLRDRFQHNAVVNQTRPYVLFYSKFEGLDLCIDASAYGGDARFIRRSCIPNSEMCHIIDNGNLHFIVQAKKEIAKGSEITIPFDFNYQDCVTTVECACGRANCPVAKFWKKVKLAQKPLHDTSRPVEKQKRKRSASGEGRVRRNSQSKGSPVKAAAGSKSPVRSSPVKSPGVVPLPPSLCEPVVPQETEVAEAVQVPKSATASRRSSRAASDLKEERDVKPLVKAAPATVSKEPPPTKAAPVQSHSSSVDSNNGDPSGTQAVSESEADSSSECPKKMTREERKMEAIMKAFEKMAKREERRKEALARLDKKHDVVKKEEPGEAVQPPQPSTGSSSESGSERVADPVVSSISPVSTFTPAPNTHDLEGKVIIKIEEPNPVIESPVKSQRRRPRRQRRRSRVQSMSAAEPLHSTIAPIPLPHPLPHLSVGPDTLHLTEEDSRDEMPGDHHFSPMPAATSTPGLPDMAHTVHDNPASYMFHKTKKHLYNEWSVSRVAPDGRHGGRMDPLEVHVGGQEEFVPYTPSPRNAIEHWQRRHSTSAGCSIRATDSAVGNAKKRWLRQAMHETGPPGAESGSSSPVHAGSCSPNHFVSLPSPGGSPPADFVTPLKKRRLARESLSQDQAPPSLPSTPSPSLTPSAPIDFINTTTVGPSCSTTAPATVTTATLAATNGQESGLHASGGEGVVGQQADSKVADDSGLGLGCNESGVSEIEAESEMDIDPVSQSSPQQEELSMDGLSSCTAINRIVRLACAGSSSSVGTESRTPPQCAMADSGDVCDSVARDSSDVQTSGISPPSGNSNEASAMEVSHVDSSGAAFEGGSHIRLEESGENVGVGSTDSEVSRPCVHNAGAPNRTEGEQDEERRVECSTDTSDSPQRVGEEVGEGAVSQGSHRVEESMEVEESGNEASGSTCEGSQETERLPASEQARQSACECQVNSSQDVPYRMRLAGRTGSPNQGEAESNVSSESVVRTQPVLDCASTSGVGDRERSRNCASTSGVVDRERSGNCASTSGVVDRERSGNCASTSGVVDRERSGNCASTSGVVDRERSGNCASTSGVVDRERSGNCASTSGVVDRERSGNCASTSGVGDRERSENCASTSGVGDRESSGNCASTSGVGDRERSENCASTSGVGDRERSGNCASTSGVGDRERSGNCASTSGVGDRERNENCASTSGAGDTERSGICASTSGAGDRERGGVSSAQDSPPVSSLVRDMDTAASSDTEFGPSSSTQVTGSVRSMRWQATQGAQAEDMVCNSSDVTASLSIMPHHEEGNVDSTSQSGGRNVLWRSSAPHSSADSKNLNSHLTEDSEASSFCDSNSERGDYPAAEEGQGVSSSGPADSQSTEVLDSGQVCVVSSVHSSVSCAPSIASSPLSSSRVADSPVSGREVCSVSDSSSQAVITMNGADVQISLHPTSSASPSHSNTALSMVDSASQSQALPVGNSSASHSTDSSDPDMVGTSSQQDISPLHGQGNSEASTSWSGATVSEQSDSAQLVSSLSPPTQGMGEGEVVNGCQAGCISSASSEDSFGAAPSTSVSSSEAQAAQQPAPVAKRKVSLFEYRKRLKGKGGSSGGPSTSPKSTTSDNRYSSRRSILNSNITLAPLPLFEPITINSDRRESKDKEEKPKLMSLSDRLRIEFGLEDSEEEEKMSSAELLAQSSMDVPPPPPLPPNGVVGGLGPRSLSATTGPRPRPRPSDDEGDSFPTAPSQGNTTPNSIVAAATAVLANSMGLNHAGASQALQPGFTWPSKLPGPSQALMGVSPGMATQQPLSTPPPAATPSYGQGVAQQPSHTHTLQAAGGPLLPNGSHSQLPAPGFSTGPLYQAPPQVHQPFRNGAKQQPPPPPPPLPNTAYPPFIAQTRTHPPPPHPQTSSQAASSSHLSTRHGRSASFSHRSPLMGVSPGATSGRIRHSSSEDHVSPSHSSGRHHYDYSQGSAVKQKGSLSNHTGSDKKRH